LTPKADEPLEGSARSEIIPLDPVDVGEVESLVARHLVDMPVGVAGAQQRIPVCA
jgi:hypothetical protein